MRLAPLTCCSLEIKWNSCFIKWHLFPKQLIRLSFCAILATLIISKGQEQYKWGRPFISTKGISLPLLIALLGWNLWNIKELKLIWICKSQVIVIKKKVNFILQKGWIKEHLHFFSCVCDVTDFYADRLTANVMVWHMWTVTY